MVAGTRGGLPGGPGSLYYHICPQVPTESAEPSDTLTGVNTRSSLRKPSSTCSTVPRRPFSIAIAPAGEACWGVWGGGCLLPDCAEAPGKVLAWPEPASTFSLARFLRLHSPPAGTNKVWELLGTTCFKLTPQLDCAEDKG